jgi:hypothetical protein
MKRCDKLAKTVQRRVYDFLLTRYGVSLLCFGILVVVVCLLQLSDTILEYRITEFKQLADIVNLKRGATSRTISTPPVDSKHVNNLEDFGQLDATLRTNIDVVYTWVNGSDPNHLAMIKKFKLNESQHGESSQNSTISQKKFMSVEFTQFYEKVMQIAQIIPQSNSTTTTTTTTTTTGRLLNSNNDDTELLTQWPCYHKLCMQTNNLIVILPQLKPMHKQAFLYNAKIMFNSELFSNITIDNIDRIYHDNAPPSDNHTDEEAHLKASLSEDSGLSVLYINNFDFKTNRTILERMNELFQRELLSKGYKMFMGYYTIDCGLTLNCVKNLNRTFIVKKLKSTLKNENFQHDPYKYLENIGKKN